MIKLLKSALFFSVTISLCYLMSCVTEDDDVTREIDGLSIPSNPISLVVGQTESQLSVMGFNIDETTSEQSSQGVFTGFYDLSTSVDTNFFNLELQDVVWVSSDPNVATVNDGLVSPVQTGTAVITATLDGFVSNEILVTVVEVLSAPDLTIDAPVRLIVFQDRGIVSGTVTAGSDLEIGGNPVSFTGDTFSQEVTDFSLGANAIAVTARNPNDVSLDTTATKTFVYELLDANSSIIGIWEGTTLGRSFQFEVSYNADSMRYDLSGTLSLEFAGFGLVEDIAIRGIVNPDGSIDASLSYDESGVEVTGSFGGFFSDFGTAEGSYAAGLSVSGISTGELEIDWTAVKAE